MSVYWRKPPGRPVTRNAGKTEVGGFPYLAETLRRAAICLLAKARIGPQKDRAVSLGTLDP
jgi:hypothetical protein